METIRTQKALGLLALQHAGFSVPRFWIVQRYEDIAPALSELGRWHEEAFARPCPSSPRHGFVQSQRVALYPREQAIALVSSLFEQALAEDPNAELILMPYIPALFNVITTPGVVAIGRGNDGATLGKNVLALPWVGPDLQRRLNAPVAMAIADAAINAAPYFEWIVPHIAMTTDFTNIVAVQLRDGPSAPLGRDFVPTRMVVNNVIVVDTDDLNLLEWENTVRALDPKTDVVCLVGSSLASHAAVHCIARGIPVFTTRIPKIGEVLEPTVSSEYDMNELLIGLLHGERIALPIDDGTAGRALRFALYAIHNAVVLRGEDTYWLGVAAAVVHRLGLAAILGELVHHPEGHRILDAQLGTSDRDEVYDAVLTDKQAYECALDLAPQAALIYLMGDWMTGYGGQAWYRCTMSWLRLSRAIRAVRRRPGAMTFAILLSVLNEVISLAHNNGWWLNEFISAKEFDYAAANHPQFAAAAAVFAYEVWECRRDGLFASITPHQKGENR